MAGFVPQSTQFKVPHERNMKGKQSSTQYELNVSVSLPVQIDKDDTFRVVY